MSIQLVVFDLDGTIIDSLSVWHDIDERFFHEHGMALPEDYQSRVSTMPFREAAIYTKQTYQLEESVDEIVDRWMEMARNLYTYEISFLDNGIQTYLDGLHKQHTPMMLATSCDPELYLPCLKRLGIVDYFQSIYCVKDLPFSKTDKAFYEYMMNDTKQVPNEILFYDDLKEVIEAAQTAGIQAVQVTKDFHFPIIK